MDDEEVRMVLVLEQIVAVLWKMQNLIWMVEIGIGLKVNTVIELNQKKDIKSLITKGLGKYSM